MQAYQASFARVYNLRWGHFAQRMAPRLADFYQSTPAGQAKRDILDLCCGTGQLSLHFLELGYRVTGIDLSEPMLHYAREKTRPHVESGRARFVQADASSFRLDQQFGLVVSTYDALNHLEDKEALRRCFQSVFRVLEPDSTFIFDLNTRAGLKRWNSVRVDDFEEVMIVSRGLYDSLGQRAYTRLSGFVLTENGLYERFEQTVYNTVFDMDWVRETLVGAGWQDVYFARGEDLTMPIDDPEKEPRVFIVAHHRRDHEYPS